MTAYPILEPWTLTTGIVLGLWAVFTVVYSTR
mgnify:CR=1 FL=1